MPKKVPQKVPQAEAIRRIFAEFGRQGGRARAANMTPEERSAVARKAAQARWARVKGLRPPEEPTAEDDPLDWAEWRRQV